MMENLILQLVSKFVIPFILLFGLYVQAHGDYGPGGGFQAGVIFAAGFILFGLVFGLDELKRVVPAQIAVVFMAVGLLLYTSVGYVTMLLGGLFLDYAYLAHSAVHGHHYGILIIELGVGITVAAVIITIYQTFADRTPPKAN